MVKNILILLILPLVSHAQNKYYFGLDVGPKADFYQLATGGSRPYAPSMEVKNDIGALFGVTVGALIEDKLMLETGLYRSNYRAIFTIMNEDGKSYFQNTPVNTFTAFYWPVTLYGRKAFSKLEGTYFLYGAGFSTLIGVKKGTETPYFSHAEAVDPEDPTKGSIAYTIQENEFNGGLLTLNLNLGLIYPVNEMVLASIILSGRLGAAGNNFIDITHETPQHREINNSIFTKGQGAQLQFGFRYFFERE